MVATAEEEEERGEQRKSEGANNGCSLWSSLGCSAIYMKSVIGVLGTQNSLLLQKPEVLSWPPCSETIFHAIFSFTQIQLATLLR